MEWVMVLMPIGLLILGFPIFIILLATSAIILLFFMQVPLTAVHQVMFGSVDKFALMAVPFFIFAGELMGMGGISQRIIAWVMSVIGGMRGSLPLTTVGTCTIFGAISGSSPATVAAVGRLMYPPLREKGYNEKFSTGVLTSSGAIAIVIPPSISMILYGASAEQSVSHLFIAGIFPGLLMSLMMGGYIYWYAARRDIREGQPFNMGEFLRASKSGIWALGTPGIILGGIYAGVFSPTEAAGIACVYAILVTKFIYGDISWRGIWDVSINSMYLTAQVLIIVAGAGVFSWLLTVSGIPQAAVAAIQELDVPPWVILMIINVFLLIVGCLLDPGSAILVLTPLLAPIAAALGVDLVHFGVIMTVNLAIGMFTPPFGLNIFVAQALFKAPLKSIYPGLVPFIMINIFALVIVTYVPEMSLYLLKFLG
ncbi:MAG: TRAP transporter large permease [Defluviicoccus sp.]|nr:TRAP transporter large permease [Defluviicoccus sp.]